MSRIVEATSEASLLREVVQCPSCGAGLSDAYVCDNGHSFSVIEDVPVLVPDFDDPATSISESFGRQWSYFRHGVDRTWGATVRRRKSEFLQLLDLGENDLRGKRVLDAGCGNGVLSAAVTDYGCEVFACDLSPSVHPAAGYFRGRGLPLHFLRANLMQHPFREGSFDVVYCAGVLHCTPDTRYTFRRVAETVAPNGRLFVWLYHGVPGAKPRLRRSLRSVVARLPAPIRHGVAVAFAVKKRTFGRIRHREDRNWRELMVDAHDFWTPRYRWEHTQDEVCSWFADLGFVNARVTKVGVDGFGVVAVRPGAS
jgi:SAM-dependent methyltransferase